MRARPIAWRLCLGAAAAVLATAMALPVASEATPADTSLAVTVSGANGVGRITQPGLACDAGGDGGSWHYGYEATLPAGTFTALPTSLRMNLDIHGEVDPLATSAPVPNGFLQGRESTISLVNERGTVVLRLADGGSCANRTASVTPATATTSGSWDVVRGTGAFATADGAGDFDVSAGIAPGADNAFTLGLTGAVSVEPPELDVTVVDTWWGNLGIDFLLRRPSVKLRVTNVGEGDAFGVQVVGAQSRSAGAHLVSGVPEAIGDLAPGESADLVVRYRFDLLGPCALILLGCRFNAEVNTSMVDALDAPLTESDVVHIETPLLGPGL